MGYGEWWLAMSATLSSRRANGASRDWGTASGNPGGTLTVDSGCELDLWNSNFGANSGYAKNIFTSSPAAPLRISLSPNTYLNANITSESNAFWQFVYGSGAQTLNGTVTLNGLIQLQAGNAPVIFSNVISGSGGFVFFCLAAQQRVAGFCRF